MGYPVLLGDNSQDTLQKPLSFADTHTTVPVSHFYRLLKLSVNISTARVDGFSSSASSRAGCGAPMFSASMSITAAPREEFRHGRARRFFSGLTGRWPY